MQLGYPCSTRRCNRRYLPSLHPSFRGLGSLAPCQPPRWRHGGPPTHLSPSAARLGDVIPPAKWPSPTLPQDRQRLLTPRLAVQVNYPADTRRPEREVQHEQEPPPERHQNGLVWSRYASQPSHSYRAEHASYTRSLIGIGTYPPRPLHERHGCTVTRCRRSQERHGSSQEIASLLVILFAA